jgi:hypothetical protein
VATDACVCARRGLLKPLGEWIEHAQQQQGPIDISQVLKDSAYTATLPVIQLFMEAITCNAPREVLSMLLAADKVTFMIRMKMHFQSPEEAINTVPQLSALLQC